MFFGLASFQALAMFRRGLFYTFLGVYLRSYLGLSVTETTLFETIPMLANIACQTFLWGRLTDRLQLRRTLIVAGEVMASLGHLAMWYLHTANPEPRASGYVIIWGLALIEVFWSMSNIGWSAYISDVYPAAERNAVQGALASVGGGGRILGALLAGLLYDGMGLRYDGWGYKGGGIFFSAAAAMLVSVIPLLFIPEGGIGRPSAAGSATPADGGEARGKAGSLRIFAIFVLAVMLINCGINSLGAFRAQYLDLEEGFAATPTTISLVNNVESASLILVGFFLGALGRRLGVARLLAVGALLGAAALGIYALAPSLGLIYAASVLKGAAEGCVASSSYAVASILIPPERRGRYFAVFNAASMLSWGLSATLVTGPLIDRLSRTGAGVVFAYRAGFGSSVLLILLGLALVLALSSRAGRRLSAGA